MRVAIILSVIFWLVVAILLVGCAPVLVKEREVNSTQVTWVQEKPEVCGIAGNFNGCALRYPDFTQCTITMPENAQDWVIAHEFKHCFGYEHNKEF